MYAMAYGAALVARDRNMRTIEQAGDRVEAYIGSECVAEAEWALSEEGKDLFVMREKLAHCDSLLGPTEKLQA